MAFYENLLPFSVRIKDIDQSPAFGRLFFLKDSKNAPLKSDVRSKPVCTLDIQLNGRLNLYLNSNQSILLK